MKVLYFLNESPFYLKMAYFSLYTLRKYNPDIPIEILLVLDNQKENRFIGKLQEFDFGIDLPDVNSFIKYCEKYKVNFTVINDLDMKEESGYHPLQRMAFTRVAEDQILLLDADTFIFDDVSPFFQALKYHDLVADITDWGRWNKFLKYEDKLMNPFNSGVVLFQKGLLQEYGKQVYDISMKLKSEDHPYGRWLFELENKENSSGKLGREEIAFAFFVYNNKINFRLSTFREIQTNNRLYNTLIHHTQTQNYIRYWKMYFGKGHFAPCKKLRCSYINKV